MIFYEIRGRIQRFGLIKCPMTFQLSRWRPGAEKSSAKHLEFVGGVLVGLHKCAGSYESLTSVIQDNTG